MFGNKKRKKEKKSHHIIQFLLAVSEGELSSFLSPMVYFRFSSSDGLSFTFLSFFFLFFFSFSFFFFSFLFPLSAYGDALLILPVFCVVRVRLCECD